MEIDATWSLYECIDIAENRAGFICFQPKLNPNNDALVNPSDSVTLLLTFSRVIFACIT